MREYDDIIKGFDGNRPLWTMFNLVGEGWWFFLKIMIVFFIKHSPVYVLTVALKYTIDYVVAVHAGETIFDQSYIWGAAAVITFLLLQNVPTHMLFIKMTSRITRRVEQSLRVTLVRRLQLLSMSFHSENESGRLQAKVLRDADMIQNCYSLLFNMGLMTVFNVLFAIIFTAFQHPFMLCFFAVIVPMALLLTYLFKKGMKKRSGEYRQELETMNAKVSAMIDMVPVARAHGVEQFATTSVEQQLSSVSRRGHSLDIFNGFFGSSTFVVMQGCSCIALGFTFYCCYENWIKVGDIALYQSFFTMIVQSISTMLNIYPQLTAGFDSIRSLDAILSSDDLEANEGKIVVDSVHGKVQFDNICFKYPNSDIASVKNFSLNIERGQSVAFVGESGSGKSTLMSLTIGFNRPHSGTIILDGKNMEEIDMRTYRSHISVVPQQPMLFSGTLRDNICYGKTDVSDELLLEAILDANLTEFIESLPDGLNSIVGEAGARLSGGQRQRIAIARALIRNPQFILFDEATSALDTISETLVQEALDRLTKGRTTFVVAHRLSTIRNADLIVAMRDGEIVEQGTERELMAAKGYFYDLASSQKL